MSSTDDNEPTPISIKLRRRFIPLKNPLATDIPKPITEESAEHICKKFLDSMEKSWKEEENCTNITIKTLQKDIQEMHKKYRNLYMEMFQNLLNKLHDDDNKALIETILLLIEHSDYAEGLSMIVKNAIQFINEGKRPALVHDNAQYVYGTKPLYFDFEFLDD